MSCRTACEAKLQSLCNRLGKEANGKRSRFLWPFSEKEHQKAVQELRNFTTWIQFALSVDGCKLLSRASDDMLKIMSTQLDQFNLAKSTHETTSRIDNAVQDQKKVLQDSSDREARRIILDWVSSVNYSQKHWELQSSRTKDTGTWVVQTDEYIRWRNGQATSNVLFCHGIQGSGKTNLVYDPLYNL